jgi:chromosomal replication initiation ATPase DnaA
MLDGDWKFRRVLFRSLKRKYVLTAKGLGVEELLQWVSELTAIPVAAMLGPGKERQSVRARSLFCYWAVKELGVALTDLAERLGISVSTVSAAVQGGGEIVDRDKLGISAFLNLEI